MAYREHAPHMFTGAHDFNLSQASFYNAEVINNNYYLQSDVQTVEEQESDVIRWMSPSNMSQIQKFLFAKKTTPGTGEWFLNSRTFSDWKSTPNSFLWLQGDVGSGKSVMAATIVNHVQGPETYDDKLVIFYFFDFRDTTKQTLTNMITSLLSQLLASARGQEIYPCIKKLYNAHKQLRSSPTDQEWITTFKEAILSISVASLFIIIDALDEMEKETFSQFYQLIYQLEIVACPNLHFLITSRPQIPWASEIGKVCLSSAGVVTMDKKHIMADVESFLENTLEEGDHFGYHSVSEKRKIKETLMAKADGMFRWVDCQLNELKSCVGPEEIDSILDQLPTTLEETYLRALQSVDASSVEHTKSILQWLCFSQKPLTVNALAQVTGFSNHENEITFHKGHQIDPARISYLGVKLSLVQITANNVIQLAHMSVKEFLISERLRTHLSSTMRQFYINEHLSHSLLAECCMTYLQQFDSNLTKAPTVEEYPLSLYAAQNWFKHVNMAKEERLVELAYELLNLDETVYKNMWRLAESDGSEKQNSEQPHSLIYAAKYGIEGVVRKILNESENNSSLKHLSESALWIAAGQGHSVIADLLLSKGVNVNAKIQKNDTALRFACEKGHYKVARLLIENGANINLSGFNEQTPLTSAAGSGSSDIVSLLLERGADIYLRGFDKRTPLISAAKNGHYNIVQFFLLSHNIDINAQDQHGSSALLWACMGGHLEIVKLIVNNGADIDLPGFQKQTPLITAIKNGHSKIASFLLERGANIHYQGNEVQSVLGMAVAKNQLSVIADILRKGARVNAKWQGNDTALRLACELGRYKMAELLIEYGADIHLPGFNEQTPLISAAGQGHLEIVSFLLSRGADIHCRGLERRTSLISAAKNGHSSVVSLLLDQKADINASDQIGFTALLWACKEGHLEIVTLLLSHGAAISFLPENPLISAISSGQFDKKQLSIIMHLIERGADVNAKGQNNDTALRFACEKGYYDGVALLIGNGADINLPGFSEQTPLISAARSGYLNIVSLLLNEGADIHLRGFEGRTPLINAAKNGHVNIVSFLLEQRSDVNAQDQYGNTALLWACKGGHLETVTLLVSHRAAIDLAGFQKQTPLISAISNGHSKVACFLLDRGANTNYFHEKQSKSLLCIAVGKNNFDIIAHLLKKGVNVNVKGQDNDTALRYACEQGHYKITKLLIENGADLNLAGFNKQRPLTSAAGQGHLKIVNLLFNKGVDLNLRGFEQRTPLISAAKNGHLDVVSFLLDKKADADARDQYGSTALLWASMKGYLEIAKLLINHRAAVNLPGSQKLTPLITAAKSGHYAIVSFLLRNGANVKNQDEAGKSALQWALYNGHKEVAKLLKEHK